MMKTHPMIFQPWGAKAIMDGRKTQTRRMGKNSMEAGDLIWVRETWQHNPYGGIVYRGGSGIVDCDGRGWKPSIHMPRKASRLTLEVVRVSVERLQQMTIGGYMMPSDVAKEGCPPGLVGSYDSELEWFTEVWDSINAKRGFPWSSDPLVWAIHFMPIIMNVDEYLKQQGGVR